jgi:hypothetical protein
LNNVPAALEDCPGNPTAMLQVFVGRVDDRVCRFNCNVAAQDLDGLA